MRSLRTDGYLIRFRRESLGESQEQLGARVGITGSYLSRIEKGQSNPSPMVTAAIAAGLRCAIEDITVRVADMAS